MEEQQEKNKNRKNISEEKEDIQVKDNTPREIVQKEDINYYFQKTLKNTLSAFFLSLIYTIINFVCNIPLLRMVSKDSYGIVKVYFELAFTLINFIPRETIRRSSQKFCPDKDPEKEKEKYNTISKINYIFLCFVSMVSVLVFISFMIFTDSKRLHENYIQLMVYIICGLVELIIEPVIMHMNLHMENKFLPITISSISRVVSNTVFVSFFGMDLWGFTLSRILGTTVYISYIFCLGLFKYKLNFFEFIPWDYKSLIYGTSLSNEINILYLREIFFQFIKLNLLNFILSRCQNVILSFVIRSSDEEKSDYSFIYNNYNLITRFLFEPIIDAFYNLVNKIKHIEKTPESDKYLNKDSEKNINISEREEVKIEVKKEEIEPEANEIQTKEDAIEKEEKEDISKNEGKEKDKKIDDKHKEINYELSIKLLQLFLKIFSIIGILVIPYYILIGLEIMVLIYGKKWETNTIDKIGDCYSYYIIILAISELIKNFGNATNDTRQMNLSYLSLIANAAFLSLFMYILSKWDICGLIISNFLSCIFLINSNYYIVFCGKLKNNLKFISQTSLFADIENFIDKCFVSKNSMIATAICVIIGNALKKTILVNAFAVLKIITIGLVGAVNLYFIYRFDYNNFVRDLNIIKEYK